MKKFLLASVILAGLSFASFASESFSNSMDSLEASYKALQAEEQAMLEARRAEAVSAQERLRGQQGILAQITKREQQIDKFMDLKFFKPEYKILKKRYADLRKDLEREMGTQRNLIKSLSDSTKK
ncbi:adhesion protein FadA [Fusobacterium sp. PH5-44]|uniref:adhesion protein FadA n=1 Tax=unclassified Fusobacterium TaxID=2648384 RepID=UPI003D2449E1